MDAPSFEQVEAVLLSYFTAWTLDQWVTPPTPSLGDREVDGVPRQQRAGAHPVVKAANPRLTYISQAPPAPPPSLSLSPADPGKHR